MDIPLTLTQRINRANYFVDQITTALNNPYKRDLFLNKDHPGYRQSTVDAIYLTFSRLKQEILEKKEQATQNEINLLDNLMMKLNQILAIFEPIANKSKTEGGSRKVKTRRKRSNKKKSRRRKIGGRKNKYLR
jgi:hypothetical protein